jgi:hypothetical protein
MWNGTCIDDDTAGCEGHEYPLDGACWSIVDCDAAIPEQSNCAACVNRRYS